MAKIKSPFAEDFDTLPAGIEIVDFEQTGEERPEAPKGMMTPDKRFRIVQDVQPSGMTQWVKRQVAETREEAIANNRDWWDKDFPFVIRGEKWRGSWVRGGKKWERNRDYDSHIGAPTYNPAAGE